LLELYASDKEKGQNCLEELGVPKGAWFIALHVREGGYLQHLNYHSYRDADVKTYLTACDEVIQRGGWAIRLGDSSMKPLPTMDRVVDYAHSTFKSDWMDIFLLTQCRFILGTTSGPIAVSAIFGKPCVLTNFTPMGHGAFQYGDLWIPKLYYLNKEERMLSIKECMSKKYRGISRSENFKNAGITLIDNTNDEIRGVTIEMLNRYDGKTDYTEEDEILQENFMTELRREPLFETEARIGKDFLKKYKFLLD